MNFVYELIKKENPDIPKEAVEYVLTFLAKRGVLSYTLQYHYEIYDFYIKLVEHYKSLNIDKKSAFFDTMQHFNISMGFLYKIINEFSSSSENNIQ